MAMLVITVVGMFVICTGALLRLVYREIGNDLPLKDPCHHHPSGSSLNTCSGATLGAARKL